MSISNLPLLKPTIKLKAVSPQMAIYGHIVSIIGGFFMVVSGMINLFDSFLGALIAIISGIFILLIELDQYEVPALKEPLNRGVAWIILGSISIFGLQLLAVIAIFVGGAFYLVYHNQ